MEAFDDNEDHTVCKTYYVYRSPAPVAHREFLMTQLQWKDFPEPGMWTLYMRTVEDERFPPSKDKVRATCHIMMLVCKPDKDEKGNDRVEALLCTNIDINGLVPKWLVNMTSKSAPTQWFNDATRATKMWHEGYFLKPESEDKKKGSWW